MCARVCACVCVLAVCVLAVCVCLRCVCVLAVCVCLRCVCACGVCVCLRCVCVLAVCVCLRMWVARRVLRANGGRPAGPVHRIFPGVLPPARRGGHGHQALHPARFPGAAVRAARRLLRRQSGAGAAGAEGHRREHVAQVRQGPAEQIEVRAGCGARPLFSRRGATCGRGVCV